MTRPAADIGRGLAGARRARPIVAGERIHVVGAAGAGASAAALLAARAGAAVSGCDPGGPSPYTAALEAAGIPLAWQHSADHVRLPGPRGVTVDRLAVTKALTAVDPDNAELVAAHALGVPTEPWQQVVADAAATSGQTLVAVAGTHGKSTTSGWLTWVLAEAGLDPAAFVGALLPALLTGGSPATARVGTGAHFVVEADEYAGNFDAFRPNIVLLTSIDWDHPDVFADRSAVLDVFEGWLRRTPEATVVANLADRGVDELIRRIADRPGAVVGVQLDPPDGSVVQESIGPTPRPIPGSAIDRYIHGAAVLSKPDSTELWMFDMTAEDHIGPVQLPTAGWHNAANASVVIGAAIALGLTPAQFLAGLATFPGVGRRMELKGEVGGVAVIDDYGHHPTAIARTMEAVRQRYPGRRLWAVYEPLTFHRTAAMLEQFADVLGRADEVAVADIWAGRDPDRTITSSAALADAVNKRAPGKAAAPGSVEATADYLAGEVRPGDVVLVMGGGRSYVIAQRLVELLKSDAR